MSRPCGDKEPSLSREMVREKALGGISQAEFRDEHTQVFGENRGELLLRTS